jgi:hypothetical protein
MRSGRVILAIYFFNIMALTDNLQAFYKLSDTSDSSGNNRTLTNNGNVSFVSGKIGNAGVFDGSNWLSAPINQNGITNYSISAWVKLNENSNLDWIVSGYTGNIAGIGMEFVTVNKRPIFGYSPGQAVEFDINLSLDWNHLVGVNNNGELKFYVNGTLVGTGSVPPVTLEGESPVAIGANSDGVFGNTTGQIDAVGIWNRALSDAEVAELYNNGTGLELDGVAQPTLVKMQAPVKLLGKVKFGV